MARRPWDFGFYLREAEDDGEPDEGFTAAGNDDDAAGDPNTADDGGDAEEASPDENAEEDTTEDPNADDTGEEGGNEEDADFDIDAGDDTGDEGEGGDPNSDESDSDTDTSASEEEEEVDPDSLKALDGKIYEDLSPAEQKLKKKQLQRLYTELYSSCTNLGNIINDITFDDQQLTMQIKRVGSMLFDLKQMVLDYFLNIFPTKSYMENDRMFNFHLEGLNVIRSIVNDLKKMYSDDSE